MDVVRELIKEVFETLGTENVYTTEHAFLPGIRISHFSLSHTVAHKKQALAQDVCRQCRTLVQEAMTEPTCTTHIDLLVGEINTSFSTSRELRCGEYSFKLEMNPWQHPSYDENIHHLLALLTALCGGCGGVVYLITDDTENVTQETFHIYQKRVLALIGRKLEGLSLSVNMVQFSLLLGTHRSWAAVLLKKSYAALKYPPVETKGIWKPQPVTFEIDMFGQIHTTPLSYTHSHNYQEKERSLASRDQGATRSVLLPIYSQATVPYQAESGTSSASATSVTMPRDSNDDEIFEIDFSSCQRLDWADNAKDWQKYVTTKELSTDDMIASCPAWKPAQPMKVTPDIDSIRYLFESEKDMGETLSKIATEEPGCAVVCRTWRFHISDINLTEDLPPGHICDILTVTDTGRLSFWVVVDGLDEQKFHSQMEYLMITGRMLKYQIVQRGEGDGLSDLWIDCRLLPLTISHTTDSSVKLRLSECREIQFHLYEMYQDGVNFELLQKALTMTILSKESPLKRCVAEHTSIRLSEQQAEVLTNKAKVNYVIGPAGNGKSYTGAWLYKMYGKEHSVYICPTKEFFEYLKFNGCTGTLVLGDEDLAREIRRGTFGNKICVVIDDCHKLTCTRKSLKKLFEVLKNNRDMSLFVFADNDYQSFDRKRQQTMKDCILDLTRTVLKAVPQICYLTTIYRNTRKVVSFVQAAIQDVYDGHQKIESANMENGEGVECITISTLWENNADNELVVYLRSLLSPGNYNQSEVAILLECTYSSDDIQLCKQIIEKNIAGVIVQGADIFPRTGVIVDSVESFLGLDANVCVFILSHTERMPGYPRRKILQSRKTQCEMNMYNPRYKVFLVSRAIYKAVFVVPKLHNELVHQMKFDHFQPPDGFLNLRETSRYKVQKGTGLMGICCDGHKIYSVESRGNYGEIIHNRACLTVYGTGEAADGSLSLLDSVEVVNDKWIWYPRPRVDSSRRVYVPCGRLGVRVFHYQDGRLLPARDPLRCVKETVGLCVNTADTVFVGDWDNKSVCLVNVFSDTVLRLLERPAQVQGFPRHMSVLEQTLIVCYGDNTLVTYRCDSPTPGQVLQTPEGLGWVTSITTDSHSSSLLVTDGHSVYVLDDKFLWHRIYTGDWGLMDCAVVQSQLRLGYENGDIDVLTSQ